jgi:hypothetical protein
LRKFWLYEEETLRKALSDADQKVGFDIKALMPQQQNTNADMSLWVNGRVDWARESDQVQRKLQVGLEFQDLTEDARRRIRDYLVNQFLQQYPKINYTNCHHNVPNKGWRHKCCNRKSVPQSERFFDNHYNLLKSKKKRAARIRNTARLSPGSMCCRYQIEDGVDDTCLN